MVVAIKTDGTMWSWGYNRASSAGALGVGDIIDRSSPTQIGSLTTWVYAGAGKTPVAIKSDGTMWSWGYGFYGTNGRGNIVPSSSPIQIGSLTDWFFVVVSDSHSQAIKTDGTLWSWGDNRFGQLGINAADIDMSSPVQVGSLTTWDFVYARNSNVGVLKTDRTAWTWGKNNNGNAGHGTVLEISSPTQLGSATDWTRINFGKDHTIGIRGG
jgi:alpha-tubulin suppressor-like RCC1 family protein